MPNMPDFTEEHEPRSFRIDDDVFLCAPALPASIVTQFVRLQEASHEAETDPLKQYSLIGDILDIVMQPASAQLFADRMQSSEKPITVNQVQMVMEWMMEEYGGRPTEPASSSSPLPTPNGLSSMAGAAHTVLPLETSISTSS